MAVSPEMCAETLLDVVPLIMRTIRAEMRQCRAPGLSVPHFRTLAYLNRYPGASLSAAAEYIGLRLPSMSTLVDGLVTRGLVQRQTSSTDRRRVTLALTAHGRAVLEHALAHTQTKLAERLAALPDRDRADVVAAMERLRGVFSSALDPESTAA